MASRLQRPQRMIRGTEGFWFREPRRRLDRLDAESARRAIVSASVGRWQWLDAVRARLDCAVEVLDGSLEYVLDPIADTRSGIDLRGLLGPRFQTPVREALAASVRSARPGAVTSEDVRIHAVPLLVRKQVPALGVGLLVIAARDASGRADRRLDAVAEWLAPAVEASFAASFDEADELRAASAFVGVFDLVGELAALDDEERLLRLAMEAVALWYDADVRIYKQAMSGDYALHASLPGAAIAPADIGIPGHNVWGRDELFTMDSAHDVVEGEWPEGAGVTRFVPLAVEDSTEWLIAISGGNADATAQGSLTILGRLIGALLTNLHRDAVERMRRRLATTFAFGDAPFDSTAQIVLDAVASETDATTASAAIFYGPDPNPVLTFGRDAPADTPFVEAGAAIVTNDRIAVGVAASAGVTMVLDLRRTIGPFPHTSGRLGRAAATLMGIWMAGMLVRPRELHVRADVGVSASFADRVAAYMDRMGRLNVSGAVVVFVPERGEMTGPLLDETMDILHERLRPTDTIGVIEAGGAAVLLPEVTPAVAGGVVVRLLQAARRHGLESARVGLATFAATAETLGSIINRALMNAGGGSAYHA